LSGSKTVNPAFLKNISENIIPPHKVGNLSAITSNYCIWVVVLVMSNVYNVILKFRKEVKFKKGYL